MANVQDHFAFACGICKEDFLADTQRDVCTIPCGHIYHMNCLTTWFRTQRQQNNATNCPTCRATPKCSSCGSVQVIRLFMFGNGSNSVDNETPENLSDDVIPPSPERTHDFFRRVVRPRIFLTEYPNNIIRTPNVEEAASAAQANQTSSENELQVDTQIVENIEQFQTLSSNSLANETPGDPNDDVIPPSPVRTRDTRRFSFNLSGSQMRTFHGRFPVLNDRIHNLNPQNLEEAVSSAQTNQSSSENEVQIDTDILGNIDQFQTLSSNSLANDTPGDPNDDVVPPSPVRTRDTRRFSFDLSGCRVSVFHRRFPVLNDPIHNSNPQNLEEAVSSAQTNQSSSENEVQIDTRILGNIDQFRTLSSNSLVNETSDNPNDDVIPNSPVSQDSQLFQSLRSYRRAVRPRMRGSYQSPESSINSPIPPNSEEAEPLAPENQSSPENEVQIDTHILRSINQNRTLRSNSLHLRRDVQSMLIQAMNSRQLDGASPSSP